MGNIDDETATPSNSDSVDLSLLLRTLMAVKKGDFSVRMPVDQTGLAGKTYDVLNDIIELNEKMAQEFERVGKAVSEEGKLAQRVSLNDRGGAWTGMIDSVNILISSLVWYTSEMTRIIGAAAKGDLSQTMALEVKGSGLQGEFLRAATTINTMVDQLRAFASEVTRVVREVGVEGKLGGQADGRQARPAPGRT